MLHLLRVLVLPSPPELVPVPYQLQVLTCSNSSLSLTVNGIADVDECTVDNGGCHHNCLNLIGSYTCSCNGGYVLNADQHTCEGKSALSYGWCAHWSI